MIVRPPQKFEVTSLPSGCTRFVSSGGTSYTCQLPVLGVNGTVDLDLPVSVQRSQVGTGRVGEYSAQVSWTDDGVSYPEPAGAWKNSLVDGNLVVND